MSRKNHKREVLKVTFLRMHISGMAQGKDATGRTVLAWGGVPGDSALVQTYGTGAQGLLGSVTEVVQPSSHRVKSQDDHFLSCSPWQVIEWEKELEYKRQSVKDVFSFHGLEASIGEVITDDKQYHYRNKQEYLFTESDNILELAIHKRGRQEKIPIQSCALVDEAIQKKALDILEKLRSKKIRADKLVDLVVRSNKQGDTQAVLRFANNSTEIIGEDLTETLQDKKIAYSAIDFFQGNTPVFEKALEDIKKYSEGKLVDIFAGVGAIGIVADSDQEITFIESSKDMCEKIHENCLLNSLEHTETLNSDARNVYDILTKEHTIILDPPREGLSEELIYCLQSAKPHKILYLSCNPQTQARDCKTLLKNYSLTGHHIYNFFPRTQHVESLCVLEIQ